MAIKSNTTKRVNVPLPASLHDDVRAAAVYRRIRWPEVIEEALTAWLATNRGRVPAGARR